MGKKLKRCSTSTSTSTSTDVEAADHKGTKAERELQKLETDVNPKKLKKSKQIDLEPKKKTSERKEMKKLRKSFKEMTETMKNLQDFFLLKADLPGISLKEMLLTKAPDTSSKEEEPPEKTEQLATYECCFKTEDADGHDEDSVFVKGFDTSLPRDDIKSALRKHFESCGCEVTRVFVPIECQTGVPLGFAFIDVDDDQKAYELAKRSMGRRMLYVMMAKDQPECNNMPPNFSGCEHCGTFLLERRLKRFRSRPRRY